MSCYMTSVGDMVHHAAGIWLCSNVDHSLKGAMLTDTSRCQESAMELCGINAEQVEKELYILQDRVTVIKAEARTTKII